MTQTSIFLQGWVLWMPAHCLLTGKASLERWLSAPAVMKWDMGPEVLCVLFLVQFKRPQCCLNAVFYFNPKLSSQDLGFIRIPISIAKPAIQPGVLKQQKTSKKEEIQYRPAVLCVVFFRATATTITMPLKSTFLRSPSETVMSCC